MRIKFTQMPSPISTDMEYEMRGRPERTPTPSAFRLMTINSLLNPSASEHSRLQDASDSPPPTPAYTIQGSSAASTPMRGTPFSSSQPKRPKLVKDAAVFNPGTPKYPVKYPPYECNVASNDSPNDGQQDLARQHARFSITPSGPEEAGMIATYPRRIPYSSDKKAFFGKTKRDAFEVFQYEFQMPDDPSKRKHTVMWDYQVGLVRITPFFKALKYTKTTPAKALTVNAGLKELSHSITGGALVAQGYWMPFACARAMCLTFCHDIRWVLTPVFGPGFIDECLPPQHAGFGKFRITSETVRRAQLEAHDLRNGTGSPIPSPAASDDGYFITSKQVPMSVPEKAMATPKPVRSRLAIKFKSPFDSDSDTSSQDYNYKSRADESPELSPKSTKQLPRAVSGWISINRKHSTSLPPPPENTPSGSMSNALLLEPRTAPATSWRGLNDHLGKPGKKASVTHDTPRGRKRRVSDAIDFDEVNARLASRADHRSPSPIKKRQRREKAEKPTSAAIAGPAFTSKVRTGKSVKFTADDARAARWLLNLSVRDSQLAMGPKALGGELRRLSSV